MHPIKVLIVDSETEFAAIVANRLCSWGYVASAVHSRDEALAVLTERLPDVAVIVLRDKDSWGLDLARLAMAGAHPVQVILLCATGATVSGMQGMQMGAADCLPLPLDLGALINSIRTATGSNTSLADQDESA
jgi:two-component system response regulator RegA